MKRWYDLPSKALIGMVHLLPLPGSPGYQGEFPTVLDHARREARVLLENGMDAVIVENYGDMPFYPDVVPGITVACMTRIVSEVVAIAGDRPVGVNVLRNDAAAALAIAAATGARFIRVNVHCGAMLTDQGLLNGAAHLTLRLRRQWRPEVAIFADVHVKHAYPLVNEPLLAAAHDTWDRGLADALILTGRATGAAVNPEELKFLRQQLPDVPIIVGSGATPASLGEILTYADAVIAGTCLKQNGVVTAPVDPHRVQHFVAQKGVI